MNLANPSKEYRNWDRIQFLREYWPAYEGINREVEEHVKKTPALRKDRDFMTYYSFYRGLYNYVSDLIKDLKKPSALKGTKIPDLDYEQILRCLYYRLADREDIWISPNKEPLVAIYKAASLMVDAVRDLKEATRKLELVEDHDTVRILRHLSFYSPKGKLLSLEELFRIFLNLGPTYTSYGYYKQRIDKLIKDRYVKTVPDLKGGDNGGQKKKRLHLTRKGGELCRKLFPPQDPPPEKQEVGEELRRIIDKRIERGPREGWVVNAEGYTVEKEPRE